MRLAFRLGDEVHPVELSASPGGAWQVTAGARALAAALRPAAAPGAGGHLAAGGGATGAAQSLVVEIDGRPYRAVVAHGGGRWWVALGGDVIALDELEEGEASAAGAPHGPLEVVSPIPGRVLEVLVAEGDRVEAGQIVVSVEAMKMENGLRAERAGRVARVLVSAGDRVEPGQVLVELAEADGPGGSPGSPP